MTKIENKEQYYSVMAKIESYLQKGFSKLTEKEDRNLAELSKAVEAWELKEYPMPFNPSFVDILQYIMQQKKLSQAEFAEFLSISKSLLSEILSGKKQPNIDVVINLYNSYGIDGDTLLESIPSRQIHAGKKASATISHGRNNPSKNSY